jgi:hypothetical protein
MVDFAAPGTGIHTALFSTPYNLPVNRYNTPLIVTVWHTSSYPKVSGSTEEPFYPARPFYDGARIIWKHWARFGSGDTTITSAESGCFPVEPILALQ